MSEPGVDTEAGGGEPETEPPSSGGLAAVGTSVAVGMTLGGRWQLDGIVGEGGTATVYRGRDLERAAAVAVKVLRPSFARDGAMRERFRREARAANLVQHPAAVKVLGDGALDDGTPYIVMEYLEGETLEARLARKGQRLPATEVLWAIDKVLDVLVAAHDRGLVHRDLKPDNIFLTEDRQIKVLDFGLARLKETAGGQAALTRIGFVMGTPSYMPPEQASGQWDQVDVQTDLWAVGATMYFLLSGRLVHEGSHVHEVVAAATSQAARPLRQAAPHLPEAVVEVVDFALAFGMRDRWPSARTMQIAVRRAHRQLQRGERAAGSDDDDDEPIEETSLDGEDDIAPPPATRRPTPGGGLLLSPATERLLHEGDTLPAIDMREAVAAVRRQHPTPAGQRPPSLSDPALSDPARSSDELPAVAPPSPPPAVDAPLSRRTPARGWGLAAVVVAVAAVGLLRLLVAR